MTGTIRHARPSDVDALERLVCTTPEAIFDAGELYGHGHLLVLDLGGNRLGGAAHLDVTENRRARLDLLVVDNTLGADTETRLVDVVRALGEAYGCAHVEMMEVRP